MSAKQDEARLTTLDGSSHVSKQCGKKIRKNNLSLEWSMKLKQSVTKLYELTYFNVLRILEYLERRFP